MQRVADLNDQFRLEGVILAEVAAVEQTVDGGITDPGPERNFGHIDVGFLLDEFHAVAGDVRQFRVVGELTGQDEEADADIMCSLNRGSAQEFFVRILGIFHSFFIGHRGDVVFDGGHGGIKFAVGAQLRDLLPGVGIGIEELVAFVDDITGVFVGVIGIVNLGELLALLDDGNDFPLVNLADDIVLGGGIRAASEIYIGVGDDTGFGIIVGGIAVASAAVASRDIVAACEDEENAQQRQDDG